MADDRLFIKCDTCGGWKMLMKQIGGNLSTRENGILAWLDSHGGCHPRAMSNDLGGVVGLSLHTEASIENGTLDPSRQNAGPICALEDFLYRKNLPQPTERIYVSKRICFENAMNLVRRKDDLIREGITRVLGHADWTLDDMKGRLTRTWNQHDLTGKEILDIDGTPFLEFHPTDADFKAGYITGKFNYRFLIGSPTSATQHPAVGGSNAAENSTQ